MGFLKKTQTAFFARRIAQPAARKAKALFLILNSAFLRGLSAIALSPLWKKTAPGLLRFWLFIQPFLEKIFRQKRAKYGYFFALALLASLGIFYFMALLISADKYPKAVSSQNINIEFLLDSRIEDLELRSRRLPKKPEEEKPPPESPKLKVQPAEMEKPSLSSQLPQLDLPEDFQSDERGAAVAGRGSGDRSVTPLFRIDPIYPRRAAMQNIEGFVVLKFDIAETGQTDNISVIQASPPQIFNSSAVQAVRKWKYKPKVENGQPVRQKNMKVELIFQLPD